jgi:hypothetical protein
LLLLWNLLLLLLLAVHDASRAWLQAMLLLLLLLLLLALLLLLLLLLLALLLLLLLLLSVLRQLHQQLPQLQAHVISQRLMLVGAAARRLGAPAAQQQSIYGRAVSNAGALHCR